MKKILLFILIGLFVSLFTIQAQTWDEISEALPTPYLTNTADNYGSSVSIDGAYAVVSSTGYNSSRGCAYVLYKDAGTWTTLARLTASDGELSDYFGRSVSISGDYIVIGASGDNDNGSSSGSAYVFEKPPTGWMDMTQNAKLTASNGKEGDYFGMAVSISGDYIAIGAKRASGTTTYSGAVYIFEKPATGWTDMSETCVLSASDGTNSNDLGNAVSISGNYVLAASIGDNGNGTLSGSAYVFEKPAGGWVDMTQTAKLLPSVGEAFDRFGEDVSIFGDVAVIGAKQANAPAENSGAVYVFEKPATGWVDMAQTAILTTFENAEYDYFGQSVSIYGDNIVVGSYDNGLSSGAAYLFEKPATGWADMNQTAKFTASDAGNIDYFGRSVSISGEYIVAGASGNDDNGSNSGSAYVFEKPTTGWTDAFETQKTLPIPYLQNSHDHFGVSCAVDGRYTVVGADEHDFQQGCAYVFYYNDTEWQKMAKLSSSDIEEGDRFGNSVGISGDYIVVGAWLEDAGGSGSGAAYVFEKPATGWEDMTQTAKLTASDPANNDKFGYSVSISGDFAVIGARNTDGVASNSGSAYVFEKPATGWEDMLETAKLEADDGTAGDNFGYSVSISGDYVVAGAYGDDDNGSSSGSAYVFEKPATGWENMTQTAKLTADGGESGDQFGKSVSISGNYVLIGASQVRNNGNYSGSAYFFEKPVSGWVDITHNQEVTNANNREYDYFGCAVSISEEYGIVGADGCNDNGNNAGAAYLFMKAAPVHILEHPTDQLNACNDSEVNFSLVGQNIDNYQWQQSTDEGISFSDLPEGGFFSGTQTDSLTVTANETLDNNRYRCIVSNLGGPDTTNIVTLTLDSVDPVTPTLADVIGDCSATVTETPTTTDNCAGTITGTTSDALTYTTQGTHVITWNFDDGNGNSINVDQNVIVEDETNPNISCVSDKEVNTDATASTYTVSGTEFDPVSTDDNCEVATVINDYNSTETLDGATLPIGTTTIKWTVTDVAGNEAECSFDVLVKNTTGIIDLAETGISIYPNPTNGILKFDFAGNNVQNLKVFDITGKVAFEKTNVQQNETMDLSAFANGLYIIIIETDKGNYSSKITKE